MSELIWQKLIDIQQDVEAIGKKHESKKGGGEGNFSYKFRGIDDLYNAIHPLHKKHGVIIIPRVVDERREERTNSSGKPTIFTLLGIEYDFVASDGSKATIKMRGEAMDSGDKGTNKAMSIALKYALMHMYLIPTEDIMENDPDVSAEVIGVSISDEELKNLKEVLLIVDNQADVLSLWKKDYLKDERVKSMFDEKRRELMEAGQWKKSE